jgi:predicted Zn-dependent protease
MVVFNPTDEIHSLRCIPRNHAEVVLLKLRNELKDTTETFEIPALQYNSYMVLEFIKTFVEGESSEIEIFDSITNDLLYRGKSYATSQTDLENYKLTKGVLKV